MEAHLRSGFVCVEIPKSVRVAALGEAHLFDGFVRMMKPKSVCVAKMREAGLLPRCVRVATTKSVRVAAHLFEEPIRVTITSRPSSTVRSVREATP